MVASQSPGPGLRIPRAPSEKSNQYSWLPGLPLHCVLTQPVTISIFLSQAWTLFGIFKPYRLLQYLPCSFYWGRKGILPVLPLAEPLLGRGQVDHAVVREL